METKLQLADQALQQMEVQSAEYLITACPLCLKTFSSVSPIAVKDIAELAAESIKDTIVPFVKVIEENKSATFAEK
jgi:Fe-S oxidoreductase